MRTAWVSIIGLLWLSGTAPPTPEAVENSDYQWLLDAPLRSELSGAADSYLVRRYERRPAIASGARRNGFFHRRPMPRSGPKRVNDPSQDLLDVTTQSEPALAVFGPHIVVSYNDSAEFLTGRSWMGYSVSHDGGKTFQDKGAVPGPQDGAALGDPAVAVDRQGVFYIAAIANDANGRSIIGVSKSTDFGETFGPMVNASVGLSPRSFHDKELLAVDDTDGPFQRNVYVTWTEFFSGGGNRILFARSTDGAQTFSEAIALSEPGREVQGSMPAVGPGGEIYVVWRQNSNHRKERKIVFRRSTNAGLSFEPAVAIATATQIGIYRDCAGARFVLGGDMRVNIGPMLAVDRGSGQIYVVFSGDPDDDLESGENGPDHSDVFLVWSRDGGLTWSPRRRVNDDTTRRDQWFPAVAVSPAGIVGVSFYDRRLDPKNSQIDLYLAISTDNGKTFQNQRITRQSFSVPRLNPNFDPLIADCYMGDYNWITSDRQNFYMVWGDNRSRVLSLGETRPDPDIFFAIEPLPLARDAFLPRTIDVTLTLGRETRTAEFTVAGENLERIRLEVFDLRGRRIFSSGEINDITYKWHLDRDDGRVVANGVYLYAITATTTSGKKVHSGIKKLVTTR
jgi:hypothetical protein